MARIFGRSMQTLVVIVAVAVLQLFSCGSLVADSEAASVNPFRRVKVGVHVEEKEKISGASVEDTEKIPASQTESKDWQVNQASTFKKKMSHVSNGLGRAKAF